MIEGVILIGAFYMSFYVQLFLTVRDVVSVLSFEVVWEGVVVAVGFVVVLLYLVVEAFLRLFADHSLRNLWPILVKQVLELEELLPPGVVSWGCGGVILFFGVLGAVMGWEEGGREGGDGEEEGEGKVRSWIINECIALGWDLLVCGVAYGVGEWVGGFLACRFSWEVSGAWILMVVLCFGVGLVVARRRGGGGGGGVVEEEGEEKEEEVVEEEEADVVVGLGRKKQEEEVVEEEEEEEEEEVEEEETVLAPAPPSATTDLLSTPIKKKEGEEEEQQQQQQREKEEEHGQAPILHEYGPPHAPSPPPSPSPLTPSPPPSSASSPPLSSSSSPSLPPDHRVRDWTTNAIFARPRIVLQKNVLTPSPPPSLPPSLPPSSSLTPASEVLRWGGGRRTREMEREGGREGVEETGRGPSPRVLEEQLDREEEEEGEEGREEGKEGEGVV